MTYGVSQVMVLPTLPHVQREFDTSGAGAAALLTLIAGCAVAGAAPLALTMWHRHGLDVYVWITVMHVGVGLSAGPPALPGEAGFRAAFVAMALACAAAVGLTRRAPPESMPVGA